MIVWLKYLFEKSSLLLLFLLFLVKRIETKSHWIVLYRTEGLGDVICAIPVIKDWLNYAKQHGLRILVIVSPGYGWIIEHIVRHETDRVIEIDRIRTFRDYKYRLNFYFKMYSLKVEKLVSFVAGDITGYLTAYSFAKEIYSFYMPTEPSPSWRKNYERQSKKLFPMFPGKSIFLQFSEYFTYITGEPSFPCLPKFQEIFPELNENPLSAPYVIVMPGASTLSRCWSADKFAMVCNEILSSKPAYRIVVLGTEADKIQENIIVAKSKYKNRIITLCGKTSLKECFCWIRNANFIIAHDSGGAHIAAAYAVPSFIIVPGTDFGRFVPNDLYINATFLYKKRPCFSCWQKCLFLHQPDEYNIPWPCMNDVSAEDMIQAIREKGFIN